MATNSKTSVRAIQHRAHAQVVRDAGLPTAAPLGASVLSPAAGEDTDGSAEELGSPSAEPHAFAAEPGSPVEDRASSADAHGSASGGAASPAVEPGTDFGRSSFVCW